MHLHRRIENHSKLQIKWSSVYSWACSTRNLPLGALWRPLCVLPNRACILRLLRTSAAAAFSNQLNFSSSTNLISFSPTSQVGPSQPSTMSSKSAGVTHYETTRRPTHMNTQSKWLVPFAFSNNFFLSIAIHFCLSFTNHLLTLFHWNSIINTVAFTQYTIFYQFAYRKTSDVWLLIATRFHIYLRAFTVFTSKDVVKTSMLFGLAFIK